MIIFLCSQEALFVVEENAQVQLIELYKNNGLHESFTNEVIEIVVQQNARLEYYKVQDENENCHHVGTTHVSRLENVLRIVLPLH